MDVTNVDLAAISKALTPSRGAASEAPSVIASPPREALDEVATAAERAEQLALENRELHFELDERSERVIIQLRDLAGHVIRTLSPSEALDVMSGAASASRRAGGRGPAQS